MKKLINLFLVGLLSISLLTGCSTSKVVSLESVAKLNNCEVQDLNLLYDEDNQISFLSGKLSNTKISNEKEAYSFLTGEMGDLLNIDDVNIDYYSSYVSTNTNVTYYRFQQTLNGDFMGQEDIPLDYLVNTLKLAVDEDGAPIAISSDLDHSQKDMDINNLMSVDEAEELLLAKFPDANIYKDYTGICFWNDRTSITSDPGGSTKELAYMIYMDNAQYTEGDERNSPYQAVIINAKKDASDPYIATLAADSLTQYSQVVENTTLQYFDNKVDSGTYTYYVNFDWMKETDYSYSFNTYGEDGMEVSVPVMYCEEDGYYYLGEAEHYITMSNYCDFIKSYGDIKKLNPYISENPEDLNSWHFKYATSSDGSVYFDDPNYVIAVFAQYYNIVEEFGTRFGFFDQNPSNSYLLTTYLYYGTYPTDSRLFTENAANDGQMYDWIFFESSPTYASVLDASTMAHEFSHGIHYYFTDVRYANQQGAVMESFADMIGHQLAMLIDEKENNWQLDGIYGAVARNFQDPNACGQPQYIDGLFYVSEARGPLASNVWLDYGGVHINSGVPNYLGYSFIEAETSENEENLTIEEGLNLWFETILLSNYDTEFKELGAILKYSANALGYSDKKQNLIKNQIQKLGFVDGVVDQELLDNAQYQEFDMSIDFDEECADKYYFSERFVFNDKTNSFVSINEKDRKIKYSTKAEGISYVYFACYDENNNVYTGIALHQSTLDHSYIYHVSEIKLKEGETYTIDSNEVMLNISTSTWQIYSNELTSANIGELIFTLPKDRPAGEYNIYIVTAAE